MPMEAVETIESRKEDEKDVARRALQCWLLERVRNVQTHILEDPAEVSKIVSEAYSDVHGMTSELIKVMLECVRHTIHDSHTPFYELTLADLQNFENSHRWAAFYSAPVSVMGSSKDSEPITFEPATPIVPGVKPLNKMSVKAVQKIVEKIVAPTGSTLYELVPESTLTRGTAATFKLFKDRLKKPKYTLAKELIHEAYIGGLVGAPLEEALSRNGCFKVTTEYPGDPSLSKAIVKASKRKVDLQKKIIAGAMLPKPVDPDNSKKYKKWNQDVEAFIKIGGIGKEVTVDPLAQADLDRFKQTEALIQRVSKKNSKKSKAKGRGKREIKQSKRNTKKAELNAILDEFTRPLTNTQAKTFRKVVSKKSTSSRK